jgi:hypothetical protein
LQAFDTGTLRKSAHVAVDRNHRMTTLRKKKGMAARTGRDIENHSLWRRQPGPSNDPGRG